MKTLLIAAAGVLALSGAAFAQDITTGHLDAIDANDDGAVDATEFDAYMVAAFKTIDQNGDGYLTLVEVARRGGAGRVLVGGLGGTGVDPHLLGGLGLGGDALGVGRLRVRHVVVVRLARHFLLPFCFLARFLPTG